MIFSFRLFLIAFLILLQCIAPLVHAHTSEKISSQGLHIPGLEVYNHPVSQAPFDTTLSVKALPCRASAFCSNIDGQLIGVDTGFCREAVLQRFYKILADLHHSDYLPAHTVAFNTVNFTFIPTPPWLSMPLVWHTPYFVHSPRAPPVT